MNRWRADKGTRPASREALAAAEHSATESKQRAAFFERILEATDEGVIYAAHDASIVFINAAARSMLGLGPRRWSPGLDALGLVDLVAETIDAGASIVRERDLHVPSRRTLSMRALPFDDGALVLIGDVTQQRRAEGVRRDFVANVSHELKTPVSGIALMAEQLAHAIREDREAALRFATRIHDEAERLAAMVVDLLDLSRSESEQPLEVDDVDAADVVRDAINRIEALAASKGVAIETTLPSLPCVFSADATLIATALGNLLDNAVRYSPEGSSVAVVVATDADEVHFSVADGGPGIPTGEINRIFERFYRVDKARARATGGTGLGLAIVKHVAEQHGGRVTAESELGRGSRFMLSFPMEATSS